LAVRVVEQTIGSQSRRKLQVRYRKMPMLDSLTRARLEWMFENEPELVKELLDQNRIV